MSFDDNIDCSSIDLSDDLSEYYTNKEKRQLLFDSLKDYFTKYHLQDFEKIENFSDNCSIVVSFMYLSDVNTEVTVLTKLLYHTSDYLLEIINSAALHSLNENFPQKCVKSLKVRLDDLPVVPEIQRTTIPVNSDCKKFVSFRCTVSRVSPVQVVEASRKYQCTACKYVFNVKCDFIAFNTIKIPIFCKNPKIKCPSSTFKPCQEAYASVKNYQEVRVNEQIHCLTVGVMPKSITICFENDLVDVANPGDDIVVNGTVMRRWAVPKVNQPCQIEVVLRANYVQNVSVQRNLGLTDCELTPELINEFIEYWQNSNSQLDARNTLVANMFPSLCGLYLPKLALALVLAGAPSASKIEKLSDNEDEVNYKLRRGSSHLLLLGDPGVAKSVLLRAVAAISHKAILTTATGSTAAGLTATAVRDSNSWILEAGALVLADTGLCAIDEFAQLSSHESAAVHEAMEQQTITVSKAGLHARLNARCSVVAAANPPHRNSALRREASNCFGIKASLLSRFDLIFHLLDPVAQTEWDSHVADFVLSEGLQKENLYSTKSTWNRDRLRQYFSWVRTEFHPSLTEECITLLQSYYCWQRNRNIFNLNELGRLTPRLLEGLTRLTLSHARLMARNVCIEMDAITAIMLVDASMQSLETVNNNERRSPFSKISINQLLVIKDFPEKPDDDYKIMEAMIKEKFSGVSKKPSDNFKNVEEPLFDKSFESKQNVFINFKKDSSDEDDSVSPKNQVLGELKKEMDEFRINFTQSDNINIDSDIQLSNITQTNSLVVKNKPVKRTKLTDISVSSKLAKYSFQPSEISSKKRLISPEKNPIDDKVKESDFHNDSNNNGEKSINNVSNCEQDFESIFREFDGLL